MLASAIILAVVILIALLRFGASVEYSESGFSVKALAGPLEIRIFPRKEKPGKKAGKSGRKPKKPKEQKVRKPKENKTEEKKPGGLQYFLEILSAAKNALSRLRRKLLIKRLTIYIIAANEDPSKTAITFGGINAAYGVISSFLENHFRIKRRDFRASADFTAVKPKIYVNAAISLALWEAIYIALALLPIITKRPKKQNTIPTERNENKDGKAPDK